LSKRKLPAKAAAHGARIICIDPKARLNEQAAAIATFSRSSKRYYCLFLTACSGQNWSSFAPVFLDDPVTHFDDLNTYALLD
jgi:hypothetical protein